MQRNGCGKQVLVLLGQTCADLPGSSVAVIDAVTKDMAARGQTLRPGANTGFPA